MNKQGYVYKSMEKYRRKFALICGVIFVLWVLFTVAKWPYIRTKMFGAVALDESEYLSETGTKTLTEPLVLDRHETKEPTSIYSKQNSYWQDGRYLFNMNISNIKKTDVEFTSVLEVSSSQKLEYPTAVIYIADLAGKTTVIIAEPEQKLSDNIQGYLVEPQRAVLSRLSENMKDGDKLVLADWFIDCRKIDMGLDSTDLHISFLMLMVLILLLIRLAQEYINPLSTPTYRQLSRYGNITDIAAEVDREVESADAYTEDGRLICENFIIENDTFKKKITRNHMVSDEKRHS